MLWQQCSLNILKLLSRVNSTCIALFHLLNSVREMRSSLDGTRCVSWRYSMCLMTVLGQCFHFSLSLSSIVTDSPDLCSFVYNSFIFVDHSNCNYHFTTLNRLYCFPLIFKSYIYLNSKVIIYWILIVYKREFFHSLYKWIYWQTVHVPSNTAHVRKSHHE